MPAPQELVDRLREAGIKDAAVIDETFDPPTPTDIEDELPVFFEDLKAEPKFREALVVSGVACASQEEFLAGGLLTLWNNQGAFVEPLTTTIRNLFSSFITRKRDPERVAEHLTALDLNVFRLGKDAAIPANVSLVFLDYNLDPGGTPPPTLEELNVPNRPLLLSETKAMQLAQLGENAPFVVLFSDRNEVKSVYRTFRQRTGYLGGTFACMKKAESTDPEEFYLRMACLGLGHPATREAQKFFWALKERLGTVAKEVQENVMALEVQDYSMIQRLALAEDGEPLGGYLLDLFGAVLSHELRCGDKVQAARNELDRLMFEKHLPSDAQPSMPVMQIYRAALTDPGIGPSRATSNRRL